MQISSALYTVCTSLRWRCSLLLFSFLNFVAENALCRATRPIPSPEKKGKEERDLSEQKESYRDKWAKKTKGRETNSRYIVSTPAPKWSTWFWLDLRKTRVASIHSCRHSPTISVEHLHAHAHENIMSITGIQAERTKGKSRQTVALSANLT